MEFGWLQSLVYGLVSGLAEILPVSADAHRILAMELMGCSHGEELLRLASQVGICFALLVSCRPRISRLSRESHIASMPKKRRKRQPDFLVLLDAKLLKTALIPLLISLPFYFLIDVQRYRLWAMALLLAAGGAALLIPQYLPRGNKDSRSLSPLDSFLMGFAGSFGLLPGISRIGMILAAGSARGADRQYTLDFALLLSVPVSMGICLLNLYSVFAAGLAGFTSILFFKSLIAMAAAIAGTAIAIRIMQFFAFKAGFSGFSYYMWGVSVLTFILYLL